ncbi:MAG: hypothetical protein LBO79_02925 [Zoogloeaceae bacterium]|jgi:hypothetical protein|nr:hypothetical protein [Zoogloeaceae bacterium]
MSAAEDAQSALDEATARLAAWRQDLLSGHDALSEEGAALGAAFGLALSRFADAKVSAAIAKMIAEQQAEMKP